jgi:transcriptional regulator with XRE-family HTH domain
MEGLSVGSSPVDVAEEIKQFLTAKRGALTPDAAGLPTFGGQRRVPGLRREEVALLAGIGVDYYTRLERGNVRGVSDSVIEALVRALQLDEAERSHLTDLIHAAGQQPVPTRRRAQKSVRASVQQVLDAMTNAAAFARNDRLDILAINDLGRRLYAPILGEQQLPVNLARAIFLDGTAVRLYGDRNRIADETVGSLRAAAGRDPFDRALTDLIGELSTRSDDFRTRWARQDVRSFRRGSMRFEHPVVGAIELDYEALVVAADEDLTIIAYTAAIGSADQRLLSQLARRTPGNPARTAPVGT